ncbi:MAG: hypothetical protein HY718_16870 [Planctomycetes bacterium]|nr:hypothetical protein [Planctomycetota bacterium]
MSKATSRRSFLKATAIGSIGVIRSPFARAGADAPRSSATNPAATAVPKGVRQLFLDDMLIERTEGLKRVVNPPTRHPRNPLIRPDQPWEGGCGTYGTAYYDAVARRFKLWYLAKPAERGLRPLKMAGYERPPHTTLLAYAESQDGVHWNKPILDQFSYDGDRRNNLIDIGQFNCEGVAILHEPDDPDPNRHWKALFWDHGSNGWEVIDGKPRTRAGPKDGIWVAFSPDGIRWKNHDKNPVIPKYSDTDHSVVYDRRTRRYVAFGRFGFGRRLARSESEDFLTWSEPKLVLECDARDGPATQIYGAPVTLYEGVYLAMMWMYREGGDGKIDTQLATSRDGVHWTRVGQRATWLSLGPDDTWEGGMVRGIENIIPRGDELYIYYGGVHGAHTGPTHKTVERKHPPMMGLAIERRDGFVSWDAQYDSGTLVTKAIIWPEDGRLRLSGDASGGEIYVAVRDLAGQPLHGFDLSAPMTADLIDHEVVWPKARALPAGPVQLSFMLRNAKLFSYWFA